MFERREFGLRKNVEVPQAVPKQSAGPDLSMYERLSAHNSEIAELVKDLKALYAHRDAGNGIPGDAREEDRMLKRLEELRKAQS